MKKIFTEVSVFILVVFGFQSASAQLYEVPLAEKISMSKNVFEGKVVARQSFWNPEHTMIFTANTVEVYKVFKGSVHTATVDVLTQGGSVGDFSIETSHLLELNTQETGMFLTAPTRFNFKTNPITGVPLVDVVTEQQGFIKYNLSNASAEAPFSSFVSVEQDLYPAISALTLQQPAILRTDFRAVPLPPSLILHSANITSFSPASVAAGAHNDPANNKLTINGSGFGTGVSGNKVVFKDGNSSTALVPAFAVDFNSPLVESWTDNQIKISVPSRAATGNFCVVLAPGDTAYAPGQLNVPYGVLTASYSSSNEILESRLMNHNGLGGYTFLFSTNTANGGTDITTDSAYDCFLRALSTWTKTTGVNAINGGTTSIQTISSDGSNIVMMDHNAALNGASAVGAGTLAAAYSSNSKCTGSPFSQKVGIDIIINKPGISGAISQPFNKYFCLPRINTFDLEAILLHEIGHGFNLAHVYGPQEQSSGYTNRNPGSVMHPTATLSVNRKSLDASSLRGGLYSITPQGNIYGGCSNPNVEMVTVPDSKPLNDDCPLVFPASATLSGTVLQINLEAATSNREGDPYFRGIGTAGTTNGTGVMVTNNVYEVIKTNGAGTLSVGVSGYSTVPVQHQTQCTTSGYLSGVQMAVYKVNSCPVGQNFPEPVFSIAFAGNGNFSIPNLEANSNYLFYFDGASNTKAVFNMTLTSAVVLPVRFTELFGISRPLNNELTFTYQLSGNVTKMVVERSATGRDFYDIGNLDHIQSGKSVFNDPNPLTGIQFYRVRIEHKNENTEYSEVVSINRLSSGQVGIYPIPMKDQLIVNLSMLPAGKYRVRMMDASGRLVRNKSAVNEAVIIPVSNLVNGFYFIDVQNSAGKQFHYQKVMK